IQAIPLFLEKAESPRDKLGDLRPFEPARANALVEVCFKFPKVIALNLLQRLLLGWHSAELFRSPLLRVKPLSSLGTLRLILHQHFLRQRIREPKRDEVSRAL